MISPILFLFQTDKIAFFKNLLLCFIGKYSWVGYASITSEKSSLINEKPVIFSCFEGMDLQQLHPKNVHRINFLYGRDYNLLKDLEIILQNWRSLGNAAKY